ncbi:MAG: hypothetical protein R2843_10305 [Thermomicrobiales bacterium]
MGTRRLGRDRRSRVLVYPRSIGRYLEGRRQRIGPAEVESVAAAHGSVQEAAAIGLPHEVKGESVQCSSACCTWI